MTTFILVLTFWTASYSNIESTAVPTTYPSVQACDDAGREAVKHYNGGATVEWTCVPAGSK